MARSSLLLEKMIIMGKMAICLGFFACFISTQSASTPPDQPQRDPYSPNAKALSKDFTNPELKKMGFKYNPHNPLAPEQLRQIRYPKARSQHSKPDDPRLLGSVHRATKSLTNAQFVHRTYMKDRANSLRRLAEERESRKRERQELGKEPESSRYRAHRLRMERAKSGSADEIMTQKTSKGQMYTDKRLRTKAEYIAQMKRMQNERSYKCRQRKKERLKKMPAGKDQQKTRQASPQRSSSSSSVDWDKLSDVEKVDKLDDM